MLDEEIAKGGGRWVALNEVADGPVEGDVLNAEKTERRTPEGDVVTKKGTDSPRYVWRLTLQTDRREDPEDDGVRKVDLNESGQRALSDAVKDAGAKSIEKGARVKIGVKTDRESKFKQAVYQARYTAPAASLAVDEDFAAPAEARPPF